MATTRRSKRKPITKAQNQILRESLKELLGSGLLDAREKRPLSPIFLKDALNHRLLNSK